MLIIGSLYGKRIRSSWMKVFSVRFYYCACVFIIVLTDAMVLTGQTGRTDSFKDTLCSNTVKQKIPNLENRDKKIINQYFV